LRRWGVWNAFNRKPISLQAGDSTVSWNYTTNTCRASNNDTNNKLTTFCGLAEEFYDLRFKQRTRFTVAGPSTSCDGTTEVGIGINSTTAFTVSSQRRHDDGAGGTNFSPGLTMDGIVLAEHMKTPTLGIDDIQALEQSPTSSNSTNTYFGGEGDMRLTAQWMG